MKIIFEKNDLILNEGKYYTPSFKVINEWITIQIKTTGVSTVSIESSIDGIDWFEIEATEFDTGPTGGLQSYSESQIDLLYRIKSTLEPISIKILL